MSLAAPLLMVCSWLQSKTQLENLVEMQGQLVEELKRDRCVHHWFVLVLDHSFNLWCAQRSRAGAGGRSSRSRNGEGSLRLLSPLSPIEGALARRRSPRSRSLRPSARTPTASAVPLQLPLQAARARTNRWPLLRVLHSVPICPANRQTFACVAISQWTRSWFASCNRRAKLRSAPLPVGFEALRLHHEIGS